MEIKEELTAKDITISIIENCEGSISMEDLLDEVIHQVSIGDVMNTFAIVVKEIVEELKTEGRIITSRENRFDADSPADSKIRLDINWIDPEPGFGDEEDIFSGI